MSKLAIAGGTPVRSAPWPRWPMLSTTTRELLIEAAEGTRWSVVSGYQGRPNYNRRFAEAFASYTGASHCVLTTNGSASLLCALEAAGIGAGDEVIVPALTWIASASAVLNVNAVPILADVDPHTLCITPDTIAGLITPRTKAILVVHLYSAVADMPAICRLAETKGLTVIEDCAQAHGARFEGRHVGTFGALGCFSMHQSKVLSCGEGGAVITSDAALSRRVEQLRADGRVFVSTPPPIGGPEFTIGGDMMGSNFCLTELQAALLLGQLPQLDEQQARRIENARHLDEAIGALGVYRAQSTSPGTTKRCYYHYPVRLDPDRFAGIPHPKIVEALSAELNFRVIPPYPAMHLNPLYAPASRRRYHLSPEFLARIDPKQYSLPAAEQASRTHACIPHFALLGTRQDMQDIAAAFEKLDRHRDELRA